MLPVIVLIYETICIDRQTDRQTCFIHDKRYYMSLSPDYKQTDRQKVNRILSSTRVLQYLLSVCLSVLGHRSRKTYFQLVVNFFLTCPIPIVFKLSSDCSLIVVSISIIQFSSLLQQHSVEPENT